MATDSFLVDKSVFLATNAQELCNFAKRHTVILPETLFYECYTSPELSDRKLFKRLDEVLMAGAHVTYQLMEIIQHEGQNLCPCDSIINYSETNRRRAGRLREEKTITQEEIHQTKRDRSKMAIQIKKLALKVRQTFDEYLKEIRRLNIGSKERFCKWIEMADQNNIQDLAAKSFRKYVIDPKRFCLSTEWLSWHYMRLMYAFAFEYSYLEITGTCPADDKAENDFMDIEYLAFFTKADVLLMKDAKCQKVAQAAFPSKKVYSSIHEING